jgi:hypothetical protein
VSTTPSGPPPSGPPSGPPSSSPSGPPSGPPTAGGPPSAGGGAPGGSGDGFKINRNQLIAIVAIIAVLAGVLVGVLAAGGGDSKSDEEAASNRKERTIKLEPIASVGDDPFTPAISRDDDTPPSTISPPASTNNTPFGGTGDNTLCDREQLISFLTDPSNAAQAREWARVVGISVSAIPTYIRDLIPTTLANDTRVTNHTFRNGRAIPLQSVLQAGTAVLVDEYGKLVARCRCGNPLLEPTEVRGPIYTGPKWPGFDPTIIVIITPSQTPVFPKGGTPSAFTITASATATNLQGSLDSFTTVEWRGTIEISDGAISGSATGRGTFDGGCYSDADGSFVGDWVQNFSFNVSLSGLSSGQTLSFTPAAGGFAITSAQIGGSGSIADDCRRQANDPSGASTFLADAFGAVELPASVGTTEITSGEFTITYTLCPVSTSNVQLVGISCAGE